MRLFFKKPVWVANVVRGLGHFSYSVLAPGGIIAIGLLASTSHQAIAACVSGGGTTTCSGDPGTFGNAARITNGSTTLIIENLTGNIAPGAGTEGVSIRSLGPDEEDPTVDPSSVTLRFTDPGHSISTSGASSVVAISRGGLGDDGTVIVETPSRGGNGGNVTIQTEGAVSATNANAIYGASLGGEGGEGGGGQNGRPGGHAGTVDILQNGAVQTTGPNANGIVAVSFGGRGGNGDAFIVNGRGESGGQGGLI